MAEQSRSKAAQVAHDLVTQPIPEGERRRRGLLLPELRLRANTPTVDINETTSVGAALTRLEGEQGGTLALREPSGEPKAIVLSVERYLQLVSKEINSAPKVGALDGRVMPTDDAFANAHVEQVNPAESWGIQPSDTPV
jgi:hypothetical protein